MVNSSYMKEYYLKNKDRIKEISNKYYHSGKGKISWNKFIENNKEKYNEYHRIYEKQNRKKNRMIKEKKEIILYFT